MSSILSHYHEEYNVLLQSIKDALQSLPDCIGDSQAATVKHATSELSAADDLLQQMDLEVRSLSGPERSQQQSVMKKLKSEVSHLKSELRQASDNCSRAQLLDGASAGQQQRGGDDRARLLAVTEKLDSSTARIKAAQEMCYEAEEIGSSILTDLSSQSDQMRKMKGTVDHMNLDLNTSRRVLRSMGRRALANKMLMCLIIFILIGLIILIIYLAFVPKIEASVNSAAQSIGIESGSATVPVTTSTPS